MAPVSLQAMDLTSLRAVVAELKPLLLPSRFEKAQQADAHTLQLGFRSLEGRTWLELSWQAEAPRMFAITPPPRGGDGSTLAQQLQVPLDGVSSFLLAARRLGIQEPTWLVQELPRRGVVAGLYGPAGAGGTLTELEPPRLFGPGVALPPGPQHAAAALLPDDVDQLLELSLLAHAQGLAAPWQPVLPLYPTSPVARL